MPFTQTATRRQAPEREAVNHCRRMTARDLRTMRVFSAANPLELESGRSLYPVDAAYRTLGKLNAAGDNAVLLCHALTGDSTAWSCSSGALPGWWDGLIGPGNALDPERHFLICSNVLGGCYGTTGPSSP